MAEIPKTYEPQAVEDQWYSRWLADDCFKADPASTKPAYSIVIPPPNVTGVLTLGHVLNNTIQDILARRARMLGKEVLWLPGTDHAGIATQTVVERKLRKEEKLHRRDLGREKFLERVWEWKEKHGGIIIQQLKKLGCSCDWSRERFTMDADYSRRVQATFVDLYNKGAIYRGKRMVNWCPVSQTALSDEEVIMKPHKGFLYYFKVEVAEEPGRYLTIATTRPETIPGDTAVAVNPKDERYAHLIGKHVVRPLPVETPRESRLIPIIGDEHVEFEFGTGVLKVTPAHDRADFEIGQRHRLPLIDIMNPDGTMNELAGEDLAELDRFEARDCAAEKLTELGLLEKEEPYENNVGFSERADVPIEPRLSEQWFLKYPQIGRSLRAVCHEDVGEDRIHFRPERWANVFNHWLENIQDWCISRQLWWGHRIPAWYRTTEGGELETYVGLDTPEGEGWEQDSDVLDTWFSSWLWPFATMDDATRAKFYPTTDLVTGPDIIFFWVARMIMAGFEYEDRRPFENVYFTGIIRDKQGRKMSKSLGNSPDPLDLIARYGADALRFGVMRSAPLGQDVLFDEKNVELGRNFCTKLWNAARFRQMQGGTTEGEINPALLSSDDKWILCRLNDAIQQITRALEEYNFAEAVQVIYRFFWSEYCDWYVEASKAVLGNTTEEGAARKANTLAVMDLVLAHTLRLMHPFIPFITEELWHGMGFNTDLPKGQGGGTILFAHWPKPFDADFIAHYGLTAEEEKAAADKYEVVALGRGLRRDFNIASNKKVRFVLRAAIPAHEAEVIKLLLNAEELELNTGYEPPTGTPAAITPLGELFLPLAGLIDVESERARLSKEIAKVKSEIDTVRKKLSNANFVDHAPAAVVAEHREREAMWTEKLAQLQRMADALG